MSGEEKDDERQSARKCIEQHGIVPGTVEPVYAIAVVEHCESLRSCSLAAIDILDSSGRPLPYVKGIYTKNTTVIHDHKFYKI